MVFRRIWSWYSVRAAWSLAPLATMGLGFVFLAGEEISWGQRIFGFETPEFLKDVNKQNEFTVHNIAILGVDFSKDLFGKAISLAVLGYLTLIPWLHARKAEVRAWIDYLLIPVPERRHFVMFLLSLALVIAINPGGKKWELYEFALSVIFLFIVARPRNGQAVIR